MENAIANAIEGSKSVEISDSFDFDSLEETLQKQLEVDFTDLDILEKEKATIKDPNNLGKLIQNVIWEQFVIQIGSVAGEDFIKDNKGLRLDLSRDAHMQSMENFKRGNIATHNTEIDYQKRYTDWQSNFAKDENGNVIKHGTRVPGKSVEKLVKGARSQFDDGRPTGSRERGTDMDHIISAAEIIRDPAANAHLTKDEQIKFANSEVNLNEIPSNLNRSKKDYSTRDWLNNLNSRGQKPTEIFDIREEDVENLLQKDDEARTEYKKIIENGETRSIQTGKVSRKKEALRVGKKIARTVLIMLLSSFLSELISKFVVWFKEKKHSLDGLLLCFKESLKSLIKNIKEHLLAMGKATVSVVTTSLLGPIAHTLNNFFLVLKQGLNAVTSVIDYIRDPENKGKSFSILLPKIGEILVAGVTGAGAIVLSDIIEKSLMGIPGFAIEIPLLGSLANVLGIFLAAVIAGVLGAIVINLLEKFYAKRMNAEITEKTVEIKNNVLTTQNSLQKVGEAKFNRNKSLAVTTISERHAVVADVIQDSLDSISKNCATDVSQSIAQLIAENDELIKNIGSN